MLRTFKPKQYKVKTKTSKCMLPMGKVASEDGSRLRSVRLFHDDTFPSFFRRADFSPDGEILAVPSGVLDVDGETDKPGHCTYIFSRSNFTK